MAAANQGENKEALRQKEEERANQALLDRDANTFYHQALSTPVFNSISKVDGAYIFDGQGKKYLDLHGNGVHTVGYNNPKVVQAIEEQIQSGLTFAPRRFTNETSVQLAESLIENSPEGLERVLFCPGGSEAIEMAIMLAKHHTKNWKTLSFEGTFHGAGFQAVSIGADPHFQEGLGPMVPGAFLLELPDYYRNPWGYVDKDQIDDAYLKQFREAVECHQGVAALISEPIFYNSTVPTKRYWEGVKEICSQHGILLIFDEIYTAFGRTGKFFACEHFVTPDILVVGKGFGGGVVPFAGIIGRDGLNTIPHKSIGHYTHEKSPFCSAVSKAVIDFVMEEQLVERTVNLGAYFKEGLESLKEQFDMIGNVTGLGLNLGVDLVKDRNSKQRATEKAHQLMAFCMERGISFKLIQGNILNFKPALIIKKEEIDGVLEVLKDGFEFLTYRG